MVTKYKSAVDWWYYAIIVFTLVVLLFVLAQVSAEDSSFGLIVVASTSIAAIGLPVWLLLSTYYLIGETELKVKSGPFTWRIDRSSIQSIEPTRSPLSSPALSLNRLEIRYGSNQSIMVSPVSQDEFIKDLQSPPNV